MGNIIGILSTVILVSTVCTLIFAVGAYVISRKNRSGVGSLDVQAVPGSDMADQFPKSASAEMPTSGLFKRAQPGVGQAPERTPAADDEYQWK